MINPLSPSNIFRKFFKKTGSRSAKRCITIIGFGDTSGLIPADASRSNIGESNFTD